MMSIREAANAIGARARGPEVSFDTVFSDSRAPVKGGLFVALRGEHFDGHHFVREVLSQGAAAAMVDAAWAASAGAELPLLVVDDTRRGLGLLAASWRSRFDIPLIGITGSNGKTTVKEMCAAILRAHFGADAVLATSGNLNNDIGLPLTLLMLRPQHRAAAIEMGMNHAGEISRLTQLARPTVAVINNAQRAHLEGLGSVTGVAKAKGEIFEGLDDNGVAVINADDPHAELWRGMNATRKIISFGIDHSADVSAVLHLQGLGTAMDIQTPAGSAQLELRAPGRHNARNALAAIAAAIATSVPLTTVTSALSAYTGIKGRLQVKPGIKGSHVIDDSYNANPDSMAAAVAVLAGLPGKRIFVMGDMGEVGEAGAQFHDELGGYAKSMGIERLFCLGAQSIAAAHNFDGGAEHFARIDDLIKALKRELDPATTVLVKGSRFMRMERVVEAITEKGEGQHVA